MAVISYDAKEMDALLKKEFAAVPEGEEFNKLRDAYDNAFWESLSVGFLHSQGLPLPMVHAYMKLKDALIVRAKKNVKKVEVDDEHIDAIVKAFQSFTSWNIHTAAVVLLVEKKLLALHHEIQTRVKKDIPNGAP